MGISINQNPFDHLVDLIGLEKYISQEIIAKVYDLNDRLIFSGQNKGALMKMEIDAALVNCATGSYVLKVQVKDQTQSLRFLKY